MVSLLAALIPRINGLSAASGIDGCTRTSFASYVSQAVFNPQHPHFNPHGFTTTGLLISPHHAQYIMTP
jgi:hypothetical protein